MIKILFAVALLCCAVFLGPRLADSQGFVHIATDNYIIETSITTALIVIIVCFLILHILVNIINGSVKLPHNTAAWFGNRRLKKKQRLQNEAFLAFEEGAYPRTLSLLRKCGDIHSLPASCLFLGSRAAFKTGDLDLSRKFLDLAEKSKDSSITATALLRARLNLQLGNTEAALENLAKLNNSSYNEKAKVRLTYECYLKEGRLDKMLELLPDLKKHELLNDDALTALSQRCVLNKLQDINTPEQMKTFMSGLKHKDRSSAVMTPVISRMVAMGDIKYASKYALEVLKEDNSKDLLQAISTWDVAVPSLLSELETQASSNSVGVKANLPLLKALSNMELKSNELTKAQEHIAQALDIEQSRDVYLLAAELNMRLEKDEEASRYFSLACKAQK